MKYKALMLAALLASHQSATASTYRCPHTVPIDSQHNRSGWYVGAYTPESGSYTNSISSTQTLQIKANTLFNSTSAPFLWSQQSNGNASATLPTGTTTLSTPIGSTTPASLVGLDAQSPGLQNNSSQSQWPATLQGALHALIIQRNHLKAPTSQSRSSHAIAFAKDHMEYRLAGSSDTVVDGVNRGQLVSATETLEVEIITEYFAPSGRGDKDYCKHLFNNQKSTKGFEVQMRPIIYVLGKNLSLLSTMPDQAGDYSGQIELSYDALPNYRPVY